MAGSLTTLGIDEAGRGPVLGPMVMAAVSLDTRGARALTRAGLRDSKSFGAGDGARATRAMLADLVRHHAVHITVRVVDVSDIDRRVRAKQLNALEREVAIELIDATPPVDRVIADGKLLFGALTHRYPHLLACNNAESRHAAVAAAAVIAKTRRDDIFARISARYTPRFGQLAGGGYVNARTRAFLRDYARAHGRLPPEARRSWPHTYLHDILGDHFDPCFDIPHELAERRLDQGRARPRPCLL